MVLQEFGAAGWDFSSVMARRRVRTYSLDVRQIRACPGENNWACHNAVAQHDPVPTRRGKLRQRIHAKLSHSGSSTRMQPGFDKKAGCRHRKYESKNWTSTRNVGIQGRTSEWEAGQAMGGARLEKPRHESCTNPGIRSDATWTLCLTSVKPDGLVGAEGISEPSRSIIFILVSIT